MEANKISSLEARIRHKMQSRVQQESKDRNNLGLKVLLKVMMNKMDTGQLKEIFSEVGQIMPKPVNA